MDQATWQFSTTYREINLRGTLGLWPWMQEPWVKTNVCWKPSTTHRQANKPTPECNRSFPHSGTWFSAGRHNRQDTALRAETLRAIAFYGHKLKIRSSDGVSGHSLKPAHQCQVRLSPWCRHFATVPVDEGSGRVSVSREVQTLICHKWRRWEVSCEIFRLIFR